MVLFLGTWAGSERGGMSQLLQRNTISTHLAHISCAAAAQPEPDSWSQLAETFELEADVQQHEQSISIPAVSAPRAATAVASATQLSMPSEADLQSQFQLLLEQSRGNGDMLTILASKLNEAEGAFQQLTACNLAGLRQPAIEKVQDGLPDSKVRMKSALEGLTR